MDKLRAIEYFVAAAREGSLSRAARRFEVSVPAIAKQVSALEREVGTVLFDRTPRGLILTTDGERYLGVCEPLVAQLAEAERSFDRDAERPRGTVVVEAPPLLSRFWLLPVLPAFHRRYPDVQIELRMLDRVTVTDAEANGIDVLVLLGWPEVADMVVRQIAQMRLLVCATPDYWARRDMPKRPADLADHPVFLVRNAKGLLLDHWRYRRGAEEEAVRLRGWLTSDRRDFVLDATLTGEGIARLADLSVQQFLASGALVPTLLDWDAVDSPPVQLLYRPLHRASPAQRVVVDFLDTRIRELTVARVVSAGAAMFERPNWYRRGRGRASAVGPSR